MPNQEAERHLARRRAVIGGNGRQYPPGGRTRIGEAAMAERAPLDLIAQQLRQIEAGRLVFPPARTDANGLRDLQAKIAQLSPAQRTVLFALADGSSNKLLARDLNVTEATIKAHLTAIYRRLQVANRAQALLAVQPLVAKMFS